MSTLLMAAILMTQQSPTPNLATYTNPVWDENFPDPYIVRDGSKFYAFATQSARSDPNGFQIMESEDLVNWRHLGGVNRPPWANTQFWAPEVYPWRGKWYMFFSGRDNDSGKRDLGVSVANHPTGPYTFLSKLVPGTSENAGGDDNGAIDPTLYFDGDRPYLLYIREAPPRAIKIVELSPDFKSTVCETTTLLTIDRPIEQGILDAPTLVKRDGTFWLFYSSGWFQSDHKDQASYRVWAASSKSLKGPYVKPETPVLKGVPNETYSPGHQCVIQLPSGQWWMAYHGWNAEGEPRYGANRLGRTLRIDPLEWTPNGPICHGPTLTPQPAPKIR